MLLKPLGAGDVNCVAVTLVPLLPSQTSPDFTPAEIPTPYFRAARLTLPYPIPAIKKVALARVHLTARQILGLPVAAESEVNPRAPRRNPNVEVTDTSNTKNDNTDNTISTNIYTDPPYADFSNLTNGFEAIKVNDRVNFSLNASGDKVGGERVLTVKRVFSSQNGKLVLLVRISMLDYSRHTNVGGACATIVHPIWREEETLVVAKLRISPDEAGLREYANELEILRLITGSGTHGMFPRLVGCGEVRIRVSEGMVTIPLLLMSYLPYPTITDLLSGSHYLPNNPYNTGDKRIFHNDFVLHNGLDCVITALQALGLRHGDLKNGNVVYRVGTGWSGGLRDRQEERDCGKRGKVWLIDLESVRVVIPKDAEIDEASIEEKENRDRRAVKDIVHDFWKYELCCAEGWEGV